MKLPALLSLALCTASFLHADATTETTRTYHVRQTVTLSDIPASAKSIKWWIAIPDDERFQEVLDFSVSSAPGPWKIVTDPDRGNRFMLVEVENPAAASLASKIEFTVRRRPVFVEIDPAQVGPITDSHRRLFAHDLRLDAPHMRVTPNIEKIANDACGTETNVAVQAHRLLATVADLTDHYSRDASKPKSGVGDADICLTAGGGTCTNMHSLFIALARARGIPARLQMGYRLRETNDGKEVDPGYRCWAEYFVPNYGWVPTDIVEADDPKGLGRTRWFTGLTERRLWLNQGREFNLPGRSVTEKRVNTMVIGYAEIDGVEARVLPEGDLPAQLTRTVFYTEVKPSAALAAK